MDWHMFWLTLSIATAIVSGIGAFIALIATALYGGWVFRYVIPLAVVCIIATALAAGLSS